MSQTALDLSRRYATVQCTTTTPNPAFKDKPTPYAWHYSVDVERAESLAAECRERWPDVTVTVVP